MALATQLVDDLPPLFKDPSLNSAASAGRVISEQTAPPAAPAANAAPPSTELSQHQPSPMPTVRPGGLSGPAVDAQGLEALGFGGATDEIRFFDYTIVHLKDKNFIESSPDKGANWGEELTGFIMGSTKQWQVQALTLTQKPPKPDVWDVADTKLDLFFSLDAPANGPEGRFNRKAERLSDWIALREAEGKRVFDAQGKEYLMLNFVTEEEGEEIIVQVAPSSAKYRWPSFINRLQSAARRSVPGLQNPAAVAEAMRNVRVRLSAGKMVETVDHPFYPMEFGIA